MSVSVKWLGQSAFELHINDTNILIDPFLGVNDVVKAEDLNPQFILITHGHGDHIGSSVEIAKRTGAKVISNVETSGWFKKHGIESVEGLNTGGGKDFGFGRVEFTIAFHSSSLPDGSYSGMPNGILIFSPGMTIYHSGDTTVFSDMRLIGEKGVDIAMLPIGDYFTMGPDDCVRAVKFIEPKYVIPMHYNAFPIMSQDPEAWAEKVRNQTTAEPVVLKLNETKVF